MHNEEEEEELFGSELNSEISEFDKMYESNEYTYFDSYKIEGIIEHLLVTNQIKKARWAAEHAMAHFPFNNTFLLRKGQILALSGELNEAIKILLKLEREECTFDILLTLATTFSQLKDSESAIKYFKKAIQIADFPEKNDVIFDLAIELEHQNNYKAAIDVLKEGIKADPKNESLVYELAYCYDQTNNSEGSIKCFLNFIDEEPYSYTAWYNLANAYAKAENNEKAVWAYEYSIIINDEFSPAYFNLGNTYMNMMEYQKGIETYEKCLEIDGDDGFVYCSIGECYEELGHYNTAYKYYKKATDLFPELSDAWLGRGIINELQGNYQSAIKEINVALKIDPENASYLQSLAAIYETMGENEKAATYFKQAHLLEPNDVDIAHDLVKNLAHFDPQEALDFVTNEALFENRPIKDFTLINCNWILGNRTEALRILEELLIKDKDLAHFIFGFYPNLSEIDEIYNRIWDI